MSEPLVSVVIVNRNGIQFIDNCLRSVLSNRYPNFEVILVDNASTDGSLESAKKHFGSDTRLKFIENPGSFGPAVARNNGIAKASGSYIAFLDNDTIVDPYWLTEFVKVLEKDNSIGAAQSKLLRIEPADTFDNAGDYLTLFGFLDERAKEAKDKGQFDYICDIFSAKSASLIIRKTVLDAIGGFDEDFYMYLEETDLCWRVWLAGYRVVFIPGSIVHHAYGSQQKKKAEYYPGYVVRFFGCRNYISTLIKNLGTLNLLKILPLHIFNWFILSAMFLFRLKLKDAWWIIKGIAWNLFNTGRLFKKRRHVQVEVRRIKDGLFFGKIMTRRTLAYYFNKGISYIYGRPY